METLINENHPSSLRKEFQNLFKLKDFSDLKFNVGKTTFYCHRVVMAVSSVFIGDILRDTLCSCEHTEILLPEVTPTIFEKILEFVYEGETNVGEEQLGEFFDLAKLFGVKGLVDEQIQRLYEENENDEQENEETMEEPNNKLLLPSSSSSINRLRATDPRPCPKCGKIYRSAHTLRTHLEDKHTSCPGFRCVLCGTVAKSRNSLHSHMSRQHRGISTKDLPILKMPSPFDPALASRLLGSEERNLGEVEDSTGSAILDTYLQFIAENSFSQLK